ncbi:hypothetical protein AX774_g8230 [Zancudomyces culisetae]|uniref:Uncharacterized protein n=1 Tax=Zancudomyces culisetae TaxID=1213189 RepID=A0A1R1PBN2_ZANCU|nr:hypothetical protein AX774_g8230 [Zancudomyces culisetae]|eukprot:OMH78385.1 hypothetical protein AX774_g8230 [Zancudomyces culisetae]
MSEDEKYKILNQIHQNVNYLKEFDFTKPALNFISLGIYPEGESSSEAKSKAGFIVRKATEAEAFHALPAIKQMLSNSSAHLQQLKSLQIK